MGKKIKRIKANVNTYAFPSVLPCPVKSCKKSRVLYNPQSNAIAANTNAITARKNRDFRICPTRPPTGNQWRHYKVNYTSRFKKIVKTGKQLLMFQYYVANFYVQTGP